MSLKNRFLTLKNTKIKKKQEGRFPGTLLAPSADLLVQLVISSVVKGRGQRWVRRAGRGYLDKTF